LAPKGGEFGKEVFSRGVFPGKEFRGPSKGYINGGGNGVRAAIYFGVQTLREGVRE